MAKKKFFKIKSDLYWSNRDAIEACIGSSSVEAKGESISQSDSDVAHTVAPIATSESSCESVRCEDVISENSEVALSENTPARNESSRGINEPIVKRISIPSYTLAERVNDILNSDSSGFESSMSNDNPLMAASGSDKKQKKEVNGTIKGVNDYVFQAKKSKEKSDKNGSGGVSELTKKFERAKERKKNEKERKAGKLDYEIFNNHNYVLAMERLKKKADDIIEEDSGSSSDKEDQMQIDESENPDTKSRKNKRKRDATHESTDDPASKRQKAQIAELLEFNLKKYKSNQDEYEEVILEKGDKKIRVDKCGDFRKIVWKYGITQKDIKLKLKDVGVDEDDYILENVTDWNAKDGKKEPDVDKEDSWDYRRKNKIYSTTYMNSILDMIKVSFMSQTQLKEGTFPYCIGRSLFAFCIMQQKMVPVRLSMRYLVAQHLTFQHRCFLKAVSISGETKVS